jgi:hypothetical protein
MITGIVLVFAVADIMLWRDRNLSAGILAGATLIWFLFDVAEYNLVTLLCHIALLGMLVLFIWSNAAPLFDRFALPYPICFPFGLWVTSQLTNLDLQGTSTDPRSDCFWTCLQRTCTDIAFQSGALFSSPVWHFMRERTQEVPCGTIKICCFFFFSDLVTARPITVATMFHIYLQWIHNLKTINM